MSKGAETRARLVDAARALLQRQGYHATGLSEVLAESGAPRGSLYYHFPGGKQELCCAAAQAAGEQMRAELAALVAGARTPAAALRRVCDALGARLEASGFAEGCPVATLALEAAASDERVHETCSAAFRAWEELLVRTLVAAAPPARRAALATLVLAAVEGALVLARAHRSSAPLRHVADALAPLLPAARHPRARRPGAARG